MNTGPHEAYKKFGDTQARTLVGEAFESRMSFIKSAKELLDIALQENVEQYSLMNSALDKGDEAYTFDHYVVTSDWDEKRAKNGNTYRPSILIVMKNLDPDHVASPVNDTNEMLIAFPVQDEFAVTDETRIEDIELSNTVYVYWRASNGEQNCFEVTPAGIFTAHLDSEVPNFDALLEQIEILAFKPLDTGAPLVARLRQDLKNLTLVPHFSVTVDVSGNEIDDPEKDIDA